MEETQKTEDIDKSPTGDVEYDKDALETAAKRMHATGQGNEDAPETEDPEDDHSEEALEEGARRMKAKGD